MHFEIYNDDGTWHWKLVDNDDETRVYARSPAEGYAYEHKLQEAIRDIKCAIAGAFVMY